MMPSIIVGKIAENLEAKQDQAVISFDDRHITGGAFWSMITRSADLLRQSRRGQRIAISLPTSPEALSLFLAGLLVAEDTGYFDPAWSSSVTQRVADVFDAHLLIDDVWSGLEVLTGMDKITSPPIDTPRAHSASKFTCFTSGTTGLPKGCRRSEQSWINSFKADGKFIKASHDDWIVVPGNFAHSLFLYAAVRGLFSGASIALFPRFNPKKVSEFIQGVRTSIIFGVPTQLEMIAQASTSPCPNLKGIMTTGAKLPSRALQKLNKAYPDASIIEFYGTTELSYVAARKVRSDDRSSLVGAPLFGVEIAIRDQDGLKVSENSPGTVYVKSNMAFEGYLTEQGFQPSEEILTVGDSGFLDTSGNLHLRGRIDRIFQSSGRKIIPENIETALLNLSEIAVAVVIPVADEIRENRICAIIQSNQVVDRGQITKHLRETLPSYEVPHHYYLCTDIPKTAGGKADIQALVRLLEHGSMEKLE